MATSLIRSRYEGHLSRAHRALYAAMEAASDMGDEGAEDDLVALQLEVGRLMQDSINGKKRKRRQQSLLDS